MRFRSIVWFCLGAVVAVLCTLLIIQTWAADAAPGDEDATFWPVQPCRVFDFRPGGFNVGPKDTPLGAGEGNVYTQQITGTVGNCVIPADASGVSLNVTVTNGSEASNLRVFPADAPTPLASNLNWVAGQAPFPNKVDVKLSSDGAIKLFNQFGTVNVLADVVGYYSGSTLRQLASGGGGVGPAGPAGPTGPAGPAGAAGSALAYAQINDAGPTIVAQRSSLRITGVSRPATGTYCLSVASSIASRVFAANGTPARPMVATVEYTNTDASDPRIEVRGSNNLCGANLLEVHTFNGAVASNNVAFIVALI